MAKEPTATVAKVRAIVMRGSYWKVDPETGERVEVKPGKGKDSEVEVTQTQLEAFGGVLARAEDYAVEAERVASESMQQITPTSDAVASTPAVRRAK